MSASLFVSLPSGELDIATRKLSVSSTNSSASAQRTPFTPIDIQAADPDTPLLYTVYKMESFTFGSSSSPPPPSPSPGPTTQPSRPRSHASHYFPTHARPGTRNSLSILEQGSSATRSQSNRTSVTSSMMFGTASTSNPTTPSLFTFESDTDGSDDGDEYAISIGSTRYEDGSSIASVRRASSAFIPDDGRYIPPSSEYAPSERRASIDSVLPPPRSNSLRPLLSIETSAPPFDADNLDEQSEEEPVTARPHGVTAVPAFHYPTRAAAPPPPQPSQELDEAWFKGLGNGIVTFDIDEPNRPPPPEIEPPLSPTLLSPSSGRRRSSLFTRWRKNSSSATPTIDTSMTVSDHNPLSPDDTFETHANLHQDRQAQQVKWVFRRALLEEKKHAQRKERRAAAAAVTPKESDKSRKGEIWMIPGIEGMYWLKRVYTDANSYQLAVQHIAPHSKGDNKKTPLLLVHRHSRVMGFSLGWVKKESANRPSSSSAETADGAKQTRKNHTMHLLATRDVQESYTSTVTVRRLEEWGLLASPTTSTGSKGKAKEETAVDGEFNDAPNSTVSAPSMLLSPRQQTLLRHHSSPPLHPSTVSDSNLPPADDEDDEDDIILERKNRKPTSHYEAFDTIPASEIFRLRGNSTEAIIPLDLPPTTTTTTTTTKEPQGNEEKMRRFLWSGTRTDKKKDKKKVKTSRSAPGYLEDPSHTVTKDSSEHSSSDPNVQIDAFSASSAAAAVNRFQPYRPPWVTFSESSLTHALPLSKQEEEKRRVAENLSKNFNRVGLLSSSSAVQSNKRTAKSATKSLAKTTVFDGIPRDALFMLLPLWVGPIQGKGRDEVRFLMVWYKVLDTPTAQQQLNGASGNSLATKFRARARASLKNSKAEERERDRRQTVSTDTVKSAKTYKSAASSATSAALTPRRSLGDSNGTLTEQHKPFHVLARLVSYNELQGSGIRVPDSGLQGISNSNDAVSRVPPGGDHLLTDYILARCPASPLPPQRQGDDEDIVGGVEFDDTCMIRLGLAVESSSVRRSPDTTSSSSSPNVRLTQIGRSVMEMAWMGALALIEFRAV